MSEMKKIFIYMMISACFAGMYGCIDLEEEPVGLLAPEGFFKAKSDVEAAIFSGYGRLSAQNIYGRHFNCALMFRGDMVDIGDPGTPAERQQVNDFNVDAGNGMVRRWWPTFYEVISAENSAIFGAEQIDVSDAVKNELIAEARFIRAFAYYQLVRVFGDIPYIGEMVTNPDAVKEQSKTSAEEVYQNIIADLEFAKEHLPDQHSGDPRSRATKGTAAAYLASVYLTLGDYDNAASEAKWVISNKNRFNYGLADDFQHLFDAEIVSSLNEPIFVIDYLGLYRAPDGTQNDQTGRMTAINRSQAGINAEYRGFSSAVPSLAVYNTWDSRDYRKVVSLDTLVDFIEDTQKPYTEWYVPRPHCAKWSRNPGNSETGGIVSDNDLILMRYAEVLLIAAEAIAESEGVTSEAMGYVNEVRARARNWAGTPTTFPEDVPAGLTKDEFIDLVLEERRLELAFEFKRWFDIVRRDLGVEVFTGPGSLEPHTNFDPTRDYLFPLPLGELDRYPNLEPQNPGY